MPDLVIFSCENLDTFIAAVEHPQVPFIHGHSSGIIKLPGFRPAAADTGDKFQVSVSRVITIELCVFIDKINLAAGVHCQAAGKRVSNPFKGPTGKGGHGVEGDSA